MIPPSIATLIADIALRWFPSDFDGKSRREMERDLVGRPVSRLLQDGFTLEVTRLCTDGTPNACSMLYSAAWRTARHMGYCKLITYILNSEPGTSLKASGWKLIGERGGGTWKTASRPRIDRHPTQQKLLFEIS